MSEEFPKEIRIPFDIAKDAVDRAANISFPGVYMVIPIILPDGSQVSILIARPSWRDPSFESLYRTNSTHFNPNPRNFQRENSSDMISEKEILLDYSEMEIFSHFDIPQGVDWRTAIAIAIAMPTYQELFDIQYDISLDKTPVNS